MPQIQTDLVVQRSGGRILIELPGGIDLVKRADLERVCGAIDDLIAQSDTPRIVISFAQVRHISSLFLGKLIAFNKRIRAKNGELALTNISPKIQEVFTLTKLSSQIPIVQGGPARASGARAAWVTLGVVAAAGAVAVGWCCLRMVREGRSTEGFRSPASVAMIAAIYLVAGVALLGLIAALKRSSRKLTRGLTWYGAGLIAVLSIIATVLVIWIG